MKQIKKKILDLLRDIRIFLQFSDEKKLFINLLRFFLSLLRRRRKFAFYMIEGLYNFNYKELIDYIYSYFNTFYRKIQMKFLLEGKIVGDVEEYLKMKDNFEGDIILDIGAYIGDSVLLFYKKGAKKIIAYEPIIENVEFLEKAIRKFNIDCIVYPYAVCERYGEIEFVVEESKYGTGGLSLYPEIVTIPKRIKVKCLSWKDVLEDAIRNNVNLAKVDCEGCEKFLIDVDDSLIKKIPEWIIECHSLDIAKKIYKKFIRIGFKLLKIHVNSYPEILILYFRL